MCILDIVYMNNTQHNSVVSHIADQWELKNKFYFFDNIK